MQRVTGLTRPDEDSIASSDHASLHTRYSQNISSHPMDEQMLLSLAIRIGLVIAALPALSTDIPDGFPPGQFTDRKIDGSMSAPSCNNELKLPCFDQGGQRAIYDLAKTQAKYFIFGFAVQDDAMDARLKSFGLQQVFAGCVIDERGYEAGYNKTIEAAFGPEFRETIFPDRDYREDQFKTLKAQTSPLDKH